LGPPDTTAFTVTDFPFADLRHDLLLPLRLQRSDGPVDAALCLAAGDALSARRDDFLHPQELERMAPMLTEKRRVDYLAGRYACKRAIVHLRAHEDPRALCIAAGVFNQPVLQSARYLGLQVSISHGAGIGAALATPETHPMAIDIEHYVDANLDAIASQLTAAELALLEQTGLPRLHAMTALWAMKEALSKVLRCGLMVPFTLLELDRLERAGACLTGRFRHFSQYRAAAIDLGAFTCAVALPRESHGLVLEPLAGEFFTSH
jgi:phosphopantetheinyl transferase